MDVVEAMAVQAHYIGLSAGYLASCEDALKLANRGAGDGREVILVAHGYAFMAQAALAIAESVRNLPELVLEAIPVEVYLPRSAGGVVSESLHGV